MLVGMRNVCDRSKFLVLRRHIRIVESVHLHALWVIHPEIYYEIQCSGVRKKKKKK